VKLGYTVDKRAQVELKWDRVEAHAHGQAKLPSARSRTMNVVAVQLQSLTLLPPLLPHGALVRVHVTL